VDKDAKILTIDEVAKYMHIHVSTAYRLVNRGSIPGFKVASEWRFNLEQIDRWRLAGAANKPS
jgi:excisionase family DNA binding protein